MNPQARGADTRRLYCFEALSPALSAYSNRQRSLSFILKLAARVWAEHGRKNLPVPEVTFGYGTNHGGAVVSYCIGYKKIELAETQHDVATLLHEITHAIGYGVPHGRGFVRKYFDLLAQYGKCEREALTLDAGILKLRA